MGRSRPITKDSKVLEQLRSAEETWKGMVYSHVELVTGMCMQLECRFLPYQKAILVLKVGSLLDTKLKEGLLHKHS